MLTRIIQSLLPPFFILSGILYVPTAMAQKSQTSTSQTDTKNKKTEDELLRDLLFCQCLQQINAPAFEKASMMPSLNASISINDWLIKWREKWVQQEVDPNHAHDPVTGQNYVWDSKKKAWIDAKTGECICPKCETANEEKKENTEPKKENEPKKEKTEKKTAMKEKTSSSNNLLAGNTGKFEVCAGVGYGFSFNGGLLGQNRTFTANDRTFDGVYGSWAQGENFYIRPSFKICECFLAGAEFDYTYGKNQEWSTNTIGATTTTVQNYEGRYTGYSATPFIELDPCHKGKLKPYADLGLRLNFSNSIKQIIEQTQTSNNNTTVTKQEATFKGAFTTGFDASLGVKYKLGRSWSLMGELNCSNSNFISKEGTITSYTINGTDQLGTLNTSQKQVEYVKNYTVPNSGFDPNSPSKALRSSQNASYLGVRLGISRSF